MGRAQQVGVGPTRYYINTNGLETKMQLLVSSGQDTRSGQRPLLSVRIEIVAFSSKVGGCVSSRPIRDTYLPDFQNPS